MHRSHHLPAGAAIFDILRVLKRAILERTRDALSGASAGRLGGARIVEALRHFNRVKSVEVIILARGGASKICGPSTKNRGARHSRI